MPTIIEDCKDCGNKPNIWWVCLDGFEGIYDIAMVCHECHKDGGFDDSFHKAIEKWNHNNRRNYGLSTGDAEISNGD